MSLSEHQHQVKFVQWCRSNNIKIFAIPNGGQRHKIIAHKLKMEGVEPGVPDLFIPQLKLFVEMKAEKGRLSPVQKEWIEFLSAQGFGVAVCYGYEDAINVVKNCTLAT